MSWLILALFMFVPSVPSFFGLMKLACDQSVIQTARREKLKRVADASLVPKLHLGTHLSAKLCFPPVEAAKLRGHLRSQVQLGNEERRN